MPADPENSSDERAPRITSARQLDYLRHELAALLTEWKVSSNPVLHVAAAELDRSIQHALHLAYAPRRQWQQRQYEAGLGNRRG